MRRIPGSTLLLFLSAALALSFGCAGENDVDRKLLVVGIDGAEWSVIEPLMAEGRLPNLQGLIESGVSCGLRSLEPKQKSPTIWTTIATGKLPEKHGIGDYLDQRTGRLLTSNVRSARTVWDIIGSAGRTVAVVGWLVTWPAEPLNGCMVSDYFRYGERAGRDEPENLTYPDDLVDEIESLRTTSDDVSDDDIARFTDLEAVLSSEEIQSLPIEEMLVEMNGLGSVDAMVKALRDLYAADRTFVAAARHLIRKRDPDATFVYLRGVDTASHKFWPAAHRGEVGFAVSRSEEAAFGHTVERYYEHADEMLGELLQEFGDDGTVIVCSDHGFEGPRPGRRPGGIRDHGPVGVLVMAGDDVRRGVRIEEQSVRDVTPTILALHGLPVAEDMDGEPIVEALTDEFLARHPVGSTETYESEGEAE
ncbi:MAG: hypothetical protein GF400_08635 [Candidatus Eisenbacteria bacterium]|nr:hypothetical protein [Candidatus Eisenbacteria bacterium]